MFDSFAAMFDWSGGASRRAFWSMAALYGALIAFAASLEITLADGLVVHRISFAIAGLMLPAMVSLGVRRLHDAGYSGLWMLLNFVPFGFLVLFWLWAKRPSRTRRGQFTWKSRHAWGVGATVLIACLMILRGFYQPFWVPTGSMKPALMPGDYVLAAPSNSYVPRRGDVVVFKHTVSETDYVKRLIGLPGDRVQMRGGIVILNGEPLSQTPTEDLRELKAPIGPAKSFPRCSNDPVGLGGECLKTQFFEAMPDATPHRVLNIETNGFVDDTTEFTVPAGNYFFIGDNRDNSLDSRYSAAVGGLGFVPASHIIGPARLVLFSSRGASLLSIWAWRPDRFLKGVE